MALGVWMPRISWARRQATRAPFLPCIRDMSSACAALQPTMLPGTTVNETMYASSSSTFSTTDISPSRYEGLDRPNAIETRDPALHVSRMVHDLPAATAASASARNADFQN